MGINAILLKPTVFIVMLNEPVLSEVEGVKHLAIAREILRCAQNDIVHHLTCDTAVVHKGLLSTEDRYERFLEHTDLPAYCITPDQGLLEVLPFEIGFERQ